MPNKILPFDKYFIKHDGMNYILTEKIIVTSKTGEKKNSEKILGYFTKLISVFKFINEEEIVNVMSENTNDNIDELMKRHNKRITELFEVNI